MSASFRLLVVPGTTPDKWSRVWSQRLPDVELQVTPVEAAAVAGLLSTGDGAAAIARIPVDQDVFHAIPLYSEATVVVVPKDHLLTAADELTLAELSDEILVQPVDDVLDWTNAPAMTRIAPADQPVTTASAVEYVAASVGVLVVPQSLARLYHRKDLTYRVVSDAPVSSVGLVWVRDSYDELVEEMIGIVRGRTANSTRGRSEPSGDSGRSPQTQGDARSQPGKGDARSQPSKGGARGGAGKQGSAARAKAAGKRSGTPRRGR